VAKTTHALLENPVIRSGGELFDIQTVIRNWSSIPAVGFNSILKLPIFKFERLQSTSSDSKSDQDRVVDDVILPNDIFGVPLRKDLAFRAYQFYRRALAGYQETMQLYKWESVGRNAKHRKQLETGRSRMGRRKAPGKYEGVFAHPLRPKDWRQGINRRVVHKALKVMLSAKFAQGEITVVDSLEIGSHKTKNLVLHMRNLLGTRVSSVLIVHEGRGDVNDNFRWASAHLPQIRRENVEGVNVYNLAKYRQLVITEKALHKLIFMINDYPRKMGWVPTNATPDGKPAPIPEQVPGWNTEWLEKRRKLQESEFRGKLLAEERRKWKWSPLLRGPLKVPSNDHLKGFRVKDYSLFETSNNQRLQKYEFQELFNDDEPIVINSDDNIDDIIETDNSTNAVVDLRKLRL
jgi:50S ribosomal protein L4